MQEHVLIDMRELIEILEYMVAKYLLQISMISALTSVLFFNTLLNISDSVISDKAGNQQSVIDMATVPVT